MINSTSNNTVCSSSKWLQKNKWLQKIGRGSLPAASSKSVSQNCGEANNKFSKSYGANKPTSYIIYLDKNNLYGHSMTQLLPVDYLINNNTWLDWFKRF